MLRRASEGRREQSFIQGAPIESAIATLCNRGQVSGHTFAEIECMVTPTQAVPRIAEHGVNPLERGQTLWLAAADNGRSMDAACRDDGSHADLPIGEHDVDPGQASNGLRCDRFQAANRCRGKLDAQGSSLMSERDSSDERAAVLRAPTDLAPAVPAAEVGISDQDRPVEDISLLALSHRLHQLVVENPDRWLAHPTVMLERQRRQSGRGLADEADRNEPYGQGQFGALHFGAGNQRDLMATTCLAPEQCVGLPTLASVSGAIAARTAKNRRLERVLQRGLARRSGSKALDRLWYRQSELTLILVHGHGAPLSRKPLPMHSMVYGRRQCDWPHILSNQERT